MLTIKLAKEICKALGLTLSKTQAGDFRVAYKGEYFEVEPSAYYTDDLMDAVDTARAMVARA
jgi:hypothetical protein